MRFALEIGKEYDDFHQNFDIHRKLTHIMAAIDDLKAQADATAGALKQLADKISSTPASTDAQVAAITAELKAATDAAAAALNPPTPPVEPPVAA